MAAILSIKENDALSLLYSGYAYDYVEYKIN